MDPLEQSSRNETPRRSAPGGRPRRWNAPADKHRAHRQRQAERQRLVGELLLAVRNARLDDPELHQVAQHGDDAELLGELLRYYRQRHWQLGERRESR